MMCDSRLSPANAPEKISIGPNFKTGPTPHDLITIFTQYFSKFSFSDLAVCLLPQ